ncbi:hypothetical protein MKW98_029906 [Papaver atlanticum]|uniref:Uncharacterized protein n=1 Tax=Papaver atlanticum TaxID=357466 RepID=A0AAD4XWX3_9MAGN|nr:hypothetical protein MKW98_029906 [Papaver atlanticum]
MASTQIRAFSTASALGSKPNTLKRTNQSRTIRAAAKKIVKKPPTPPPGKGKKPPQTNSVSIMSESSSTRTDEINSSNKAQQKDINTG